MRRIAFTLALPLAAFLALAPVGCNGPTKAGQAARDAARNRAKETSAVIVYDQAMQSFKSGQFDRAFKEIDEAILRLPTEARFWTLRGRIGLETGKLDQAERDFGKAIELDPTHAEAHYRRGMVFERWQDFAKAGDEYGVAAEKSPEKLAYALAAAEMLVAQARHDEARAFLEPKLDRFENSAVMHQLLGRIDLLAGDPVEATRRFNRALILDPTLPLVLDDLMRAQWAAGQWVECLRTVQRLQKEGPDGRTAELMRLEGRCLVRLDRLGDARVVFAELTRGYPEDVTGWLDLGTTAWSLGDLHRTVAAANRLVSLAPRRFEGYLLLGLVARQQGNAANARDLLEKARTLSSGSSELPQALLALDRERPLPTIDAGPRANAPAVLSNVPLD